ncbi:hypothetical protein BDV96DRAFT_642608 [Lophiotrema nucula]|uniref:non-specific serine/threonine protein kinase n=1 Tax=Lophiotrema nucula TaxID=690887 RepID=A0A6A5ZJL7_9PLEO|nr:hypothetical protein BDV96DRAFT_642608 [Lophiotrema nucula]
MAGTPTLPSTAKKGEIDRFDQLTDADKLAYLEYRAEHTSDYHLTQNWRLIKKYLALNEEAKDAYRQRAEDEEAAKTKGGGKAKGKKAADGRGNKGSTVPAKRNKEKSVKSGSRRAVGEDEEDESSDDEGEMVDEDEAGKKKAIADDLAKEEKEAEEADEKAALKAERAIIPPAKRGSRPPSKTDMTDTIRDIPSHYPVRTKGNWRFLRSIYTRSPGSIRDTSVALYVHFDDNDFAQHRVVVKTNEYRPQIRPSRRVFNEVEARRERDIDSRNIRRILPLSHHSVLATHIGIRNYERVRPPLAAGGPNVTAFCQRFYIHYCPHGSLADLINSYDFKQLNISPDDDLSSHIPEAFIWLVFHNLAEALWLLNFGAPFQRVADGWIPLQHRDIKPENVFLDTPSAPLESYPTPCLGDLDSCVAHAEIHNWMGTVGYVAPENTDDGFNHWRFPDTHSVLKFFHGGGPNLLPLSSQGGWNTRPLLPRIPPPPGYRIPTLYPSSASDVFAVGLVIWDMIYAETTWKDRRQRRGTHWVDCTTHAMDCKPPMVRQSRYSEELLRLMSKCLHLSPSYRPPVAELRDTTEREFNARIPQLQKIWGKFTGADIERRLQVKLQPDQFPLNRRLRKRRRGIDDDEDEDGSYPAYLSRTPPKHPPLAPGPALGPVKGDGRGSRPGAGARSRLPHPAPRKRAHHSPPLPIAALPEPRPFKLKKGARNG